MNSDPAACCQMAAAQSGMQVGEAPDDSEKVLVHEEVLAQGLLRTNRHGRRKAAVAFSCVRAASSACSILRTSASTARV